MFLADWIPPIALFGALWLVLWRFYMVESYQFHLTDVLVPFVVLLMVLIVLHIVIVLILPIRWPTIRGEFSTAPPLQRLINTRKALNT